jgi:predicted  nucleic acid-binding Zn-ribbon protein
MAAEHEMYPERRSENYELQKQVYGVDGKIARVEAKFDSFTTVFDERWKSMEMRLELASRQQQQAIELVTGAVLRVDQRQSDLDARQGTLEKDIALLEKEAETADKRFGELKDSITWLVRAVVGMGLTILAAVVVAFLTR